MNRILLAISIGLFFLSCGSSKISESNGEIVRLTIASQRGNCAGSAAQKCLMVKTDNSQQWTFLYYGIQNFKYEEGSEYVIDVRKERTTPTVTNTSSFRYVFVKEISKTLKQSEGLPR